MLLLDYKLWNIEITITYDRFFFYLLLLFFKAVTFLVIKLELNYITLNK